MNNEELKAFIKTSRAVRLDILRVLYVARVENPDKPWVWCRDIEQAARRPVAFELDYLIERGDLRQDGPKYRITAAGIDRLEELI